jgi:predicted  nucleic acid-binding Zn-ribbon protein
MMTSYDRKENHNLKKIVSIFFAFSLVALSGCNILDEVNGSLNYVNESTEYINKLQAFGEAAPSLMKEAATNPEAKVELEEQITALETYIQEFNEIEPPSIASKLHKSVVEKNDQLLEAINSAMENGELSLEKLQNSDIFTTINQLTEVLDQIKQLQ